MGGFLEAVPCGGPFCHFACEEGWNHSVPELVPNLTPVAVGEAWVYPIGFAIPEELMVPCLPKKYWPFAVSDGSEGLASVWEYQFKFYQEREYHRQYRHAFFGITRKKYGYDCLRHYEVIANGALPLFLGLDALAREAVPFLPRELLRGAWELLGNQSLRAKRLRIDTGRYYALLKSMLAYARRHLTTKAMARYVLGTMGFSGCPKILFLSGRIVPDYQRDLLLHGLKTLCASLGARGAVVEVPRVDHLYGPDPRKRPDPKGEDWQKRKGRLYGNGFTYAMTLEFAMGQVDRTRIRQRILDHEFDLVMYGSVYRGQDFMDEVQAAYLPKEIAFIDGEDLHGEDAMRSFAHAGFHFRRELVVL
ncbi:unnamed protein product [Effrenium voratum]|nr:unnamed protein product [Effrenium voratum]